MPDKLPDSTRLADDIPARQHKPPAQRHEPPPEVQADNRLRNSRTWRRVRAAYLADEPLCKDCYAAGKLTPAEHVHHVVKPRGDPVLFFAHANLAALCARCHGHRHAGERQGGG